MPEKKKKGSLCETCLKRNIRSRLKFRHINFDEGIYLCSTPSCFNLESLNDTNNVVVKKNFKKPKRKKNKYLSPKMAAFLKSLPSELDDLKSTESNYVTSPPLEEAMIDISCHPENRILDDDDIFSFLNQPSNGQFYTDCLDFSSLIKDEEVIAENNEKNVNDAENSLFGALAQEPLLDHKDSEFESLSNKPFNLPEDSLDLYSCGPCIEEAKQDAKAHTSTLSEVDKSKDLFSDCLDDHSPLVKAGPPHKMEENKETCSPLDSRSDILEEMHSLLSTLDPFKCKGSFPIWTNNNNSCWVDASLCLLVFNQKLVEFVIESKDDSSLESALLFTVITSYQQVKAGGGGWLQQRLTLEEARHKVFSFLRAKLNYEDGHEESLLIALQQLIKENKAIESFFQIDYWWTFDCLTCGRTKKDCHKVVIPTVVETGPDFSLPNNAYAFVRCNNCTNSPKYKKFLRFDKLPKTFCIHFLHGLPKFSEISKLDFYCNNTFYRLTGIVLYRQNPNHFVTYSRYQDGWIYCDDLSAGGHSWFVKSLPAGLDSQLFHVLMWEEGPPPEEKVFKMPSVPNSPCGSIASESSSGVSSLSSSSTSTQHQQLRNLLEIASKPKYPPYFLHKRMSF